MRAIALSLVSTDTSQVIEDAGNANPDQNFRFDPTLAGTGGYIFNFKTTGLGPGTYNLTFVVGNDPTTYTIQFKVG